MYRWVGPSYGGNSAPQPGQGMGTLDTLPAILSLFFTRRLKSHAGAGRGVKTSREDVTGREPRFVESAASRIRLAQRIARLFR